MFDFGGSLGPWPWVGLAGLGLLLLLLYRRYRTLVRQGNVLPPGVGGTRLVGMTGVVTQTVDPTDGVGGRVQVAGDSWRAVTDSPSTLVAGTVVRVLEVRGNRVAVEATGARTEGDS